MRAETGRTVLPRQIITTVNAPISPLYSQGAKAGPHVLVSGIVGIARPYSRQAAPAWPTSSRSGILLTNPADFAGLNEEYARRFPSEPPTRYVAKLGVELPGLLVSIRMTAFIT